MLNLLSALFRHPKLFYWHLKEYALESQWNYRAQVTMKLHDEIREVELLPLIRDGNTNLPVMTFRSGGSSLPDYLLLAELCKQYAQCYYFEIGTFLGESIANVSPYCQKCVSLSLRNEEYAATDVAKRQAEEVSRMFSKNLQNVHHVYGDSLTFDFSTLQDRFDVIFIDGCHKYEYVKSDTEHAFRLLRNEHSVIVFHDAKNAYNDPQGEVLCGIYDGTPIELRKYLYTVENTLCAIYGKKPLATLARTNLRTLPYASPKLFFNLNAKIIKL